MQPDPVLSLYNNTFFRPDPASCWGCCSCCRLRTSASGCPSSCCPLAAGAAGRPAGLSRIEGNSGLRQVFVFVDLNLSALTSQHNSAFHMNKSLFLTRFVHMRFHFHATYNAILWERKPNERTTPELLCPSLKRNGIMYGNLKTESNERNNKTNISTNKW